MSSGSLISHCFIAFVRFVFKLTYEFLVIAMQPVNYLLSLLLRNSYERNSVLHISNMVHIAYYTTRILREHGMKADYLAIGQSKVWDRCDYQYLGSRWPIIRYFLQFYLLWMVVRRYEIVHLHFMITISPSGWEIPHLKRMGRKIVVHYRGCEIRERARNMALHPTCNICQECDYHAAGIAPCANELNLLRQTLTSRYGDLFLVTTPDLKDFAPDAIHLPFFSPPSDLLLSSQARTRQHAGSRPFKIFHATNHPGIEGTSHIAAAIDRLREKGYAINFVFLTGVSVEQALAESSDADLAIGKMKMGYYANSQIESMILGIPTVTYIRPEFVTPELENSGLILASLPDLEKTIEYYLTHPGALEAKRQIAAQSIQRLHDNNVVANKLIAMYRSLCQDAGPKIDARREAA